MIRARVQSKGFPVVVAKLADARERIRDAAKTGLNTALAGIAGIAQRDFLQGPRPAHLGEVTGRLRNSIVWKVNRDGAKITGTIGTNVVYAPFHEFGFKGVEHIRGFPRTIRKGKRAGQSQQVKPYDRKINYAGKPFLRSAIEKGLPVILNVINKEIQHVGG